MRLLLLPLLLLLLFYLFQARLLGYLQNPHLQPTYLAAAAVSNTTTSATLHGGDYLTREGQTKPKTTRQLNTHKYSRCVSSQENYRCVFSQENSRCISSQENSRCISSQENSRCISSQEDFRCVCSQENSRCISSQEDFRCVSSQKNSRCINNNSFDNSWIGAHGVKSKSIESDTRCLGANYKLNRSGTNPSDRVSPTRGSYHTEQEVTNGNLDAGVDNSSIWAQNETGETRFDEIRKLFGGQKPRPSSKSLSDFRRASLGKSRIQRAKENILNFIDSNGPPVVFTKESGGKEKLEKFDAYDNFRGSRKSQHLSSVNCNQRKHEPNPVQKLFERRLSISNIKKFNQENEILTANIKSQSASNFPNNIETENNRINQLYENKYTEILSDSNQDLLKISTCFSSKSIADQSIISSSEFLTPRSQLSSPGPGLFKPRSQQSSSGPELFTPRSQHSPSGPEPFTPGSNQLSSPSTYNERTKYTARNRPTVYNWGSVLQGNTFINTKRDSLTNSCRVDKETVNNSFDKHILLSNDFVNESDERDKFTFRSYENELNKNIAVDKHSSILRQFIIPQENDSTAGNVKNTPYSSHMLTKKYQTNRPSRASAFNVRQTIEKRAIELARKERRALRKKLKKIRLAFENQEQQDSTDSETSSIYLSCNSVRSKSLSSLDQDTDDFRSESPLVKVQSNPTLESEKKCISDYLYASNLVDYTPCLSSRLVAKAMSPTCSNSAFSEAKNHSTKITYIQIDRPESAAVPGAIKNNLNQSERSLGNFSSLNDERSITDNEKWQIKQNTRQINESASSSNSNKYASQEFSSECYNNQPALIRFARDRRSLKTNQLMLEDISDRTSSIAAIEPDWVKRARKKLESLNIPLCSSTEAGSASSHLTESSAWSRGGLDALDELRQESCRVSIALAGAAQTRVVQDLRFQNSQSNRLELPSSNMKSIEMKSNAEQSPHDSPSNDDLGIPDTQTSIRWTTSELPKSPREEVRFGDLKHDWGGVQTATKTTASGRTKEMRFGSLQVTDIPNNSENNQSGYKRNQSSCVTRHSFSDKGGNIEKSSSTSSLPTMHFGDTPINVLPDGLDKTNEAKKSSKFESISGPDPCTMTPEQLNQNVEEYDFPIPTGEEDASELLKFLEDNLKKVELVPQVISSESAECIAQPKSILKRRSVDGMCSAVLGNPDTEAALWRGNLSHTAATGKANCHQ